MKTKVMKDKVVINAYHVIGTVCIGVMSVILLIAAATTAVNALGF